MDDLILLSFSWNYSTHMEPAGQSADRGSFRRDLPSAQTNIFQVQVHKNK